MSLCVLYDNLYTLDINPIKPALTFNKISLNVPGLFIQGGVGVRQITFTLVTEFNGTL